MRKTSGRVTINEIAKAAGVSVTTVSRAMNHADLVNPETRARIFDAMHQLGYAISKNTDVPAKKLNRRVVVVNTPTPGHAFYDDFFRGIMSCATRYGWFVMLNEETICPESYESFLMLLKSCNAVGLIGSVTADPETLAKLQKELPVIQCFEMMNEEIPYIGVDDEKAAKAAVDYLISIGRKNIAVLCDHPKQSMVPLDPGCISRYNRFKGYVMAHEQAGIEYDPNNIIHVSPLYFSDAYNAMKDYLWQGHRPDAIFAVVDTLAYGAIIALQDFGLRVPEDVAVVGYDNIPIAQMCRPRLTSVSVPRFEIGRMACEMLHQCSVNPEVSPRNVVMSTELIVRDST